MSEQPASEGMKCSTREWKGCLVCLAGPLETDFEGKDEI